jgi:RNA polymerase sigma-70 factor, ECF subfamily
LIASARTGDPAAWAGIVSRHQDRVFTLCLRMMREHELAADMTQETFVKAIQGLRGFDQRSLLSTWLYRIATNTCLSELRARRHRERAKGGETLGPTPESREPTASSGVEQDEVRRRLLEGLAKVTDDQRAILVLRDVRGLDYGQIASVLRIAPGTVRSRLFRARAALRKELAALERRDGYEPAHAPLRQDGSGRPDIFEQDEQQNEQQDEQSNQTDTADTDDSNWDSP